MADPNRIHIVLESLPGARAQVSINIATPWPGMRVDTPAHSLAIDVLGWLGKQPEVAGFVYSPAPAGHSDDQQILLTASGMLQRIGYHAAADAVLRAMDAAGQPAPGQDKQSEAVRQALRDYHYALDTRQHGGSAAWKALGTIQEALGMRWVHGAETSRRAIDATGTDQAAQGVAA